VRYGNTEFYVVPEGKRPLARPGVHSTVIFKLTLNRREDVAWIHLDRVRYHWRYLVNTIMNLRVP
jgi:hypothetical protein